ncbi:S41 family peptidase [Alteromonas sp.]|nr:S41 family peptidase [Alteromonas sp.]
MKLHHALIALSFVLTLMFASGSVRAQDNWLEQHEIEVALKNLIIAVEADYLFDENRALIVERLTSAINQRDFDGHYQFERFKRKLESMLFAVSKDSRFEIQWRASSLQLGVNGGKTFPGTIETQWFDDGVAYLLIDGDFTYSNSQEDINEAMAYLMDAKALVIDLTGAGYIDFAVANGFLQHFIPAGQPMVTLSLAHGNALNIVSEADVTLNDIPVYIVTSSFVAGTWEFVSYTLQHAGRATVVGEPTMGLSTMKTTTTLSEHISVVMAYAEPLHPVTKVNHKDEGVTPDIESNANEALDKALSLAYDAIADSQAINQ